MEKVLEDIRVLDFGRFVACPYCGMALADMGAEVIRVERPGGEEDRTIGLLGPNGQNVNFSSYARNKKGITLNLIKNPKGRKVLADLVKKCDVVIHNFTPQAAKMMGLTYDLLKEINPRIILAAMSCFGSEGPYADRPGFDFIAQAMSGAMGLGGYPDKPPIRAFMLPMDFGTGMAAAYGIMVALRHRDKTGEGQLVDLSLLRTALSYTAPQIAEVEVLGQSRPIIGNRVAYVGPSDLYECNDGYVFIACIMNSLWKRLVRVIGCEELLADPELQNDFQRYQQRDRIDPLLKAWTAERTVEEVMEIMGEAHIPCGPFREPGEVTSDPHVRETGMMPYVDMEESGLERVPVSNTPVSLSKTPGSIESRPPRVGEHNNEIYADLLGYEKSYLEELIQANAI